MDTRAKLLKILETLYQAGVRSGINDYVDGYRIRNTPTGSLQIDEALNAIDEILRRAILDTAKLMEGN